MDSERLLNGMQALPQTFSWSSSPAPLTFTPMWLQTHCPQWEPKHTRTVLFIAIHSHYDSCCYFGCPTVKINLCPARLRKTATKNQQCIHSLNGASLRSLLMAAAMNFQSASNFNRRGGCIIYAYFLCTHAIIITSLSHSPQRGLHELQGSFMLLSPHSTFNIHPFYSPSTLHSQQRGGTCVLSTRRGMLNFSHLLQDLWHRHAENWSCVHDPGSGWFCCMQGRTIRISRTSGFFFFSFTKLNGNALDFCSEILRSLACSILSFTFGFGEERVEQSGRLPWFRGFGVAGGDAAAVTLRTRLPSLSQRRCRELLFKKNKNK